MVKARGKKGFFRRFQVVVVLVNWISYNIASDTTTWCTFYSDTETTIKAAEIGSNFLYVIWNSHLRINQNDNSSLLLLN